VRYASLALGDDGDDAALAVAVAALELELSASASMSASAAGAADAVPAAGALTFGYTDAPALFSLAPAAVLAAVPAIVTMTVAGFGDVATATALVSPGSADDADGRRRSFSAGSTRSTPRTSSSRSSAVPGGASAPAASVLVAARRVSASEVECAPPAASRRPGAAAARLSVNGGAQWIRTANDDSASLVCLLR
jgi:hypothetical protein